MTHGSKQRRSRSVVQVRVRIQDREQRHWDCESADLSLNGVLLEGKDPPPVGTTCQLEIELPGAALSPMTLSIQARVVRHSPQGFALTFEQMDPDTFEHLKKLVLYQSSQPEKVLEENKRRPGYK